MKSIESFYQLKEFLNGSHKLKFMIFQTKEIQKALCESYNQISETIDYSREFEFDIEDLEEIEAYLIKNNLDCYFRSLNKINYKYPVFYVWVFENPLYK